MNTETRQRIIDLIIQGYYSGGIESLKVGKIADAANITRQALHRYHGDLIDYIKGIKDVAELLPKTEKEAVDQLLIDARHRVLELEKALCTQVASHERKLSSTVESYITSLMQNDITLYETDEITLAFEKQSSLIENYTHQINELKVQLAKVKLNDTNQKLAPHKAQRLVIEPNLMPALLAYKRDENYDNYLDLKDNEIAKIISKTNAFKSKHTRLVIFLERLICDFSSFVDSLPPSLSDEIVIRLPLYSNIEIKSFISSITLPGAKIIYVPECLSISESSAQRKFRSINVPKQEVTHASKAEHVYVFKGIEQVIHYVVSPGI